MVELADANLIEQGEIVTRVILYKILTVENQID